MQLSKTGEIITRIADETGLSRNSVAEVLAAYSRILEEGKRAKAAKKEANEKESLDRMLERVRHSRAAQP